MTDFVESVRGALRAVDRQFMVLSWSTIDACFLDTFAHRCRVSEV